MVEVMFLPLGKELRSLRSGILRFWVWFIITKGEK